MIFKKKNLESKASMREIDPAKEKCHCGSGKRYENCHGLVKEDIHPPPTKDSKEDKPDDIAEQIHQDEHHAKENSNHKIGNTYRDATIGFAILAFISFLFIKKGTGDYESFFSGIVAPVQVIFTGIASLLSGGGDQQTIALAGVLDTTWHSGTTIYKTGFGFGVFLIATSIKYVAALFAVVKTLLD